MRGEGDAAPEGEICPRYAREKQPQTSSPPSPHKRRHHGGTPSTHDCTPGSQVDTLSRVADSVTAAIAELRSSLLAGEIRPRYARDRADTPRRSLADVVVVTRHVARSDACCCRGRPRRAPHPRRRTSYRRRSPPPPAAPRAGRDVATYALPPQPDNTSRAGAVVVPAVVVMVVPCDGSQKSISRTSRRVSRRISCRRRPRSRANRPPTTASSISSCAAPTCTTQSRTTARSSARR